MEVEEESVGSKEEEEEAVSSEELSAPPPLVRSFCPSPSLARPPSTRRRRDGELPGVLRGELLAVLQGRDNSTDIMITNVIIVIII